MQDITNISRKQENELLDEKLKKNKQKKTIQHIKDLVSIKCICDEAPYYFTDLGLSEKCLYIFVNT